MKLIDNPLSPYAMKIRMILYEKGIDFESQEIHTKKEMQDLKSVNPRAEVPALIDGDKSFSDSKVIAEYLEETHPEPALLPKDPAARAECRILELVADTELDAAVIVFSLFKFFRPELAEKYPDVLKKAEAGVRGHYAYLNQRLDGRAYLLGEFCRADLAFMPHLGACGFLGLAPGDDTPHLSAWVARMNERESVARTTQEAIGSLNVKHDDPAFDPNHLHWRSDRIEQLLRVGLGEWLQDELKAGTGFLPPGRSA